MNALQMIALVFAVGWGTILVIGIYVVDQTPEYNRGKYHRQVNQILNLKTKRKHDKN